MPPAQSSPARFIDEPLLDRAFKRSNAPRWNLSRNSFAHALERSVASRFATETWTPASVSQYVDSLNLEELALACACAEGQVSAWAYFIECHRPGLRAAARAIAGGDEGGELADSLYAELYGLDERDGHRRSLFDYFHGRSRLSTWLRSILAQRHVDRIRAARKMRPLDEEDEALPDRRAVVVDEEPDRARFAHMAQQALGEAIGRLEPRDRLRLSFYYLQRLTLAQIGRLLGEHEATASRKLARIRRELRAEVQRQLRQERGMGDAQVQACMEFALEDVGMDLDQWLGDIPQEREGRKNGREDRSERRSAR
jgi:RNA polymerase sigma factor (sigma-70 family)